MLTDFILDHFIFIGGIAFQLFGIFAGLVLPPKDLLKIKMLLFLSSLLILFVFSLIIVREGLESFTSHEIFPHWNEQYMWTVCLGLWLIGMAGQMAAILFLSLRFQKINNRIALLEAIQSDTSNPFQK